MTSTIEPLVSIGIPTYNRPEGLRQALVSLRRQTYQNLEILISDNSSPGPETERVVREFMVSDARIRYLRQPQNVGAFSNFQGLIEHTKGDYFAWMADDDDREPGYIAACMQGFQRSDALILVNSFSELLDPRSGRVLKTDRGCSTMGLNPAVRYRRYLSSILNEQAAVGDLIYGVIKREALTRVTPLPNIINWDHLLLARLALEGEFYTIPQPLMRSHPGGMSSKSPKALAKIQLIEGSASEKRPWWVREKYLQQAIQETPHLSRFEKLRLSAWSYWYYTFSIAPQQLLDTGRRSPIGRLSRRLKGVS